MKVVVGEGLLEETFAHLRRCGAGSRECVCYWSGPLATPGTVDRVHHPIHTASGRYYEVDGAWLDQTWRDLSRESREIRVQNHSHGGRAYHSEIDDEFPVVACAGLFSLVVPSFGCGSIGLEDAFLAQLTDDGSWSNLEPTSVFEVAR